MIQMGANLLILSIARHWAITLIERVTTHAKLRIDCAILTDIECELLAQVPVWNKSFSQNTPTTNRHLWDCGFDGLGFRTRLVFHFYQDETAPCEHFELRFFEHDDPNYTSSLLACLFFNDTEFRDEGLIFYKTRIIHSGTNPCHAPAHIQGRHRVMLDAGAGGV